VVVVVVVVVGVVGCPVLVPCPCVSLGQADFL